MNYQNFLPQMWKPKHVEQWRIDMGQRLRVLIKVKYGKRKEHVFAEEIGISQGSLSEILNGISTPSALTLLKIIENTNMSVIYILRG